MGAGQERHINKCWCILTLSNFQ